MFDTYGPYALPTQDLQGLNLMVDEIKAGPFSGLENGVGIYIVVTEDDLSRLTPQYVGQTYKSYRGRFKQHIKHCRFERLKDMGKLKVFLLARAKGGHALSPKDPGQARRDRKYIDFLEVDLIDRCRKINPNLLNVREVGFLRGLYVAGYRDQENDERDDAAISLALMLKTERQQSQL
jgi:hypothetical protein